MTQPSDDDLRASFDQLRDDERAHAPDFRALWDRAEVRSRTTPRERTIHRPRTPAYLWLAAAAALVLAVGLVLPRSSDRDRPRVVTDSAPSGVNAAPTISNWRSPTAGLLRTSDSELLAPPSILSSILDGAAHPPVQRKGD